MNLHTLKNSSELPEYYNIPGLLPTGIITLRGKKNIGKTWLTLKLAIDASQGNPVFGSYPCESKRVFYYARQADISSTALFDRCTDLGLPVTYHDTKKLFHCQDGTGLEVEVFNSFSLKRIKNIIEEDGAEIVIIDPADSLLSNSQLINTLAWDHGVSIILVTAKTMTHKGLWETSHISEVDWTLMPGKDGSMQLQRTGGENEETIQLQFNFSDSFTDILNGWGRKPVIIKGDLKNV